MRGRHLLVMALLVLAACGGGPSGEQAAKETDAALLEAAQAPLERAQDVQQTIDASAAKMERDAAAAMEGLAPDADPDAKKKEDETQP